MLTLMLLLVPLGCQRPKRAGHGSEEPKQQLLPPLQSAAARKPTRATGSESRLKEEAHFGGPRFLTDAEVKVVAQSPDGKMLASGGGKDAAGDAIILWDAASGHRIGMLGGEDHEATQLAFSPDGATLASSELHREVLLWDVASRRVRLRLKGHPGSVYGIAYAPNGEHVASFDGEGAVMLFSTRDGAARTLLRDSKGIDGVAFSPNAAQLAVAHVGRITLWDVATGKRTGEHRAGSDMHALRYGPHGKQLLIAETSGAKQQASIMDVTTGSVVTTVAGHSHHINQLYMTRDGKSLITASSDATIRVWDVATGSSRILDAEGNALWSLAVSADERHVTAVGQGRSIRQWELRTGKPIEHGGIHREAIVALAYAPDGGLLASGDNAGVVVVRNALSGKVDYVLPPAKRYINELRYSPDGALLFTVSGSTIRAFDARTGAAASSPLTSLSYSSIAFSPDGRFVAGSSAWPVVDLIDAGTGTVLRKLGKPHAGDRMRQNLMQPTSVAFSPDRVHVATARWDESVRIFELSSGKLVRTLAGKLNVAYGDSGLLAANVGTLHKRRTDLSLKLFNPISGQEQCSIAGAGAPKFALGGELVAAIVEGEVRLWKATDGALVTRAGKPGHHPVVFAFSPDGKYLASGGKDADVAVWRTPSKSR